MTLLLTLLLTAAAGGWAAVQTSAGSPLGCRDQDNRLVDWYVLYKLPILKDPGSKKPVSDGYKYLYISSASTTTETPWSMSKEPIDSQLSHPARTLAPVYKDHARTGLFYRFYNDHWPSDKSPFSYNGHAKGVLAHEGDHGFWMIHSVPKFPPAPTDGAGYSYPDGREIFGQSFLCISFSTSGQDTSGQLHNQEEIRTSEGVQITTFAKSSKYNYDLYSALVAPALKTDLHAETWRATLMSHCSGPYQVEDVHYIRAITASETFQFKSINDHSKWAVSINPKKPWVCIGDLNRAETQMRRGGGAVCLKDDILWETFSGALNVNPECMVVGDGGNERKRASPHGQDIRLDVHPENAKKQLSKFGPVG
ncbi:deoxyribonuclease-2-alpha-like [Amphibalanus amphitrite]|uniref:deoxyribonuclease-2-alpha-like n=1 Tax=Amphibalanus amphitrite TaxID=1232801 RepID=UPI001C8FCBAF|nr:deoxyribonuclease-2-alpha-like [Amphibalanus amphitrite]